MASVRTGFPLLTRDVAEAVDVGLLSILSRKSFMPSGYFANAAAVSVIWYLYQSIAKVSNAVAV